MKSFICNGYTLITADAPNGGNVIISSHGGVGSTTSTFTTPIELRFFTHCGVTTKKQIRHIPAMIDREFEIEAADTHAIRDHQLSWYEHDPINSFEDSVGNGFDVVTIQRNQHIDLSTLVNDLDGFGYTCIYCLFCRVNMVAEYVKVMP